MGFLIASLVAIIVWYYQKSTSAEDGALDVLDRYARSQARVRNLEHQLATLQLNPKQLAVEKPPVNRRKPTNKTPDDFRKINGIGPGYARRLEEAGITSFDQLASTSAEDLRQIVGSRPDVEAWILAAHQQEQG
jgi:predicted flap endonuclease-1-like 5' DNA nuclease